MNQNEKLTAVTIKFLSQSHISKDFFDFIHNKITTLVPEFIEMLEKEGINEPPIGLFVKMYETYLAACAECCFKLAENGAEAFKELTKNNGTVH